MSRGRSLPIFDYMLDHLNELLGVLMKEIRHTEQDSATHRTGGCDTPGRVRRSSWSAGRRSANEVR
jgi:hypothetical protein